MEAIHWKIEGMTCSNCALTINKYLEKTGLGNVNVNLPGSEVSFELIGNRSEFEIKKGIEDLGYKVIEEASAAKEESRKKPINQFLRYLIICAPFTFLLLLPMLDKWVNLHWLMNPWLQLILCIPVYVTGMIFFGRSAWMSIRNGMPNMNVLVALGASAAFFYSLTGTIFRLGPQYAFYETAAAIITLIFLGNFLEDLSIRSTQKALDTLARAQKIIANMIAFDENHEEHIFPVDSSQLRSGDLILIKSGEQVPADAKILWGNISVNESIITGESLPVEKNPKDKLIGGSLVVDGTAKAQVTAAAKDSVLSGIINLVKKAQADRPPVQKLADRISAVFVPVVLIIAAITFALNYLFLHELTPALMRSIAVLVIACPCAMGLATPAAIAVGLGRAARSGILFRNAVSLESFKNIRQIVFDKTGTLTTGNLTLDHWQLVDPGTISEEDFKSIVYSLEKYSNHPIAICISKEWKSKNEVRWSKLDELKGLGIQAKTASGDEYLAGSYKLAAPYTNDEGHDVYVIRNGNLVGWIDLRDELRPEAGSVIKYLHSKQIRSVLLSGDRLSKCETIRTELGIDEVIAGQSPSQKLEQVARLNAVMPTAMVGDGINDAPALAKAAVGISISDASHIAMQTADVVLMSGGLKKLPEALGLGKHTYLTIGQNLFWAFIYNIIAIPVASIGLLTPAVGALAMGLSDVVLLFNSTRLFVKKVK
ncbi:MAG: cadmium-translocating P-type ATPase [Bacteroidetes bacterium]|nr:MAG: cadmium-translocating P-type ATPase [Bacteroidota bacterium]